MQTHTSSDPRHSSARSHKFPRDATHSTSRASNRRLQVVPQVEDSVAALEAATEAASVGAGVTEAVSVVEIVEASVAEIVELSAEAVASEEHHVALPDSEVSHNSNWSNDVLLF